MRNKVQYLLLLLLLLCSIESIAQEPQKKSKWGTMESERQHQMEKPEPIKTEPQVIKKDTVRKKSEKIPPKPKPEPTPKLKQESKPGDMLPATCFYAQPTFQIGSLMAAGLSVGGYFSNFNAEAFYMMGLSKSEDIYWSNTSANSDPILCSYKPSVFGLRLGYGFGIRTSFRLTPQLGFSAVSIKSSNGDSKGNASSVNLGLRADYAIASHFQLFAAPELALGVSKSKVYEQLADVSSKIKSWSNGFNLRLGLSVSF